MKIDLSTALLVCVLLVPFVASIGVWRFRNHPHWIVWLTGSTILGWFFLIVGDSAYYSSLNAEYGRTHDPEVLERVTNDAGSGLLLVIGPVISLIWNLAIFGLFAFIRVMSRRLSRCRECSLPAVEGNEGARGVTDNAWRVGSAFHRSDACQPMALVSERRMD